MPKIQRRKRDRSPEHRHAPDHGQQSSIGVRRTRAIENTAAQKGRAYALKVLAASGVDVNAKDSRGWTLAHVAAQNGHARALRVLSARGADLNATIVGGGWTPIHFAAESGHLNAVKVLAAAGADVNAKTNCGRTPAYFAAEAGHHEVLQVLATNGADVNTPCENGWAPSHIAANNGHTTALTVLSTNDADFNARTDGERTPVFIAARKGHTAAVGVLASNGADVKGKCARGSTPACVAAQNGHADVLKALAVFGADLEAKNSRGKSPAYLACMASEDGHVEALKVLVGNGADIHVKMHGKSVVDVARGGCAAYLAEVATETLRSLRKQLYEAHLKLESTTQQLELAKSVVRRAEGEAEASLLALFDDVDAVMAMSEDWASPRADPAVDAQRGIDAFVRARTALTVALSDAVPTDPTALAQCRADCCAAARALLDLLPPLTVATGVPAVPAHPPPELVDDLKKIVATAKHAHAAATATVIGSGSAERHRPLAAVARAVLAASDACAPEVDVVRAKLSDVRAALAVPTAFVTAEECRRQRALAESVLEAEHPWAGDAGIKRRQAALVGGRKLVARRAAAQRAFDRKEKLLAVAKAALAVFSDDDNADDDTGDSIEAARAALRKAKAERAAALPTLLGATAAVQEWATSGKGALALKAFPGDAELTAALAELFEAEFTAHTALSRTPGVRLDVEYPAGLVESPAAFVFYAERVSEDNTVPVVLRRLRLSSPGLVQEAQRQVQDAGRIAVGLQSCPDAAAGCAPVVKVTRWFLATGPGGGTADAWLEFPRAKFGSLAQAVSSGRVFNATAASGLCVRVVRAVAQMHAAGIRHGDLNPSNVVLWDDPASDVVRPGIIDLLDTAVVGTTRTLRGATLEWLPPEATEAVLAGTKAYSTRELDCWQLGRICEAVLNASSARPDQLLPLREAAAALCVADPAARTTAATALLAMDATLGAMAAASVASPVWALPPATWLCERGEAPGVAFVALDVNTDAAAAALVACAASVGRRVRSVHRLENLRLWHVYAAERARVAEEAQGAVWPERLVSEAAGTFPSGREALVHEPVDAPGEALLLHGALEQSHRLIAEGGLDPSYSGDRGGALFGAATCLTPSWEKAANQYARGAGAGVFVTRAVVGCVADCWATHADETRRYRRPPDGHHSVLGDNGNPGAVVAVYRPSRMYPEYLVVFDD